MSDREVIGETSFLYKDERISVKIYSPEKSKLTDKEYVCWFIIEGGEISYNSRAIGLDSMQALILSLRKIGTYIECNEEIDRSEIAWEGGVPNFPVFQV